MHVSPSQFSRVYAELKRTSLSHSTCKLILFVSCLDIDSLCAAKVLTNVLKKDLIQYQLIPVVGYSDLKLHFDKLDEEVTNVVLLGCGAMLDVETFLEIDTDKFSMPIPSHEGDPDNKWLVKLQSLRRKIYVIDGHRPWNLDNVFGSNIVVCFDDGELDEGLETEKEAYEKLVTMDEDSQSESESDSDPESQHEPTDDDEDEDDDDMEIHSQDDPETADRKRRRQEQRSRKLRKQRRREIHQLEDTIETYYSQGTTINISTTSTIYALLSSIGETTIENLWLSIIGTSSLDNNYPEVYDKFQPLFRNEVHRLSPSNLTGEKTADSTVLTVEKDYHLFLLRHWTLYDSFFYSSHVNSKLNLWTEDGKKRLHKLFAKMGVSLATAQQKWIYMDINIKKKLPLIFSKYLPLYGLESIIRDGFIRTFGFSGQLSAMECVESLMALLESDHRLYGESVAPEPTQDLDDQQINDRIAKREKIWVNNFWYSWDALNMTVMTPTASGNSVVGMKKAKGFDLLLEGLEDAKKIQQIIFRTGMSLLERKQIKNLRLYRLCVLNDGSIPDLHIFNNPLILTKLGGWLLENITELEFVNNPNTNSLKPLVVASLDTASDTYLVIGLAPKYPRGLTNSAKAKLLQQKNESDVTLTTRLNTFSVAFQKVANNSGAKVRIDSFDSSVIEIRKDDLSPFLEKLTLSGLI